MKIDINKVDVKKIDKEDISSIMEIAQWFDGWYEWEKPFWTKKKIIKKLKEYAIEKDDAFMLVAKYNEKVVGTVALLRYDDTKKSSILTPWIANAYVSEEYRENGIYKKLLHELFSYSRIKQFKKLYLWTDWDDLYEKIGFEYIGNITIDNGSKQKLYTYNL